MNAKDLKILSHLRQDARMPLTKMSKKIQIPVSTIFDKIRNYENGLILRHTTLINFEKLGYSTRANISLKVNKEDREDLKNYLVKNQLVNSVYKINNGYDYMIEGIFKNIKDMEDFIECMEHKFDIMDHKCHFIVQEIKRESFMAEPDLVI